MVAVLKEEKRLSRVTLEIINELLTTLVYKALPDVPERGATILIGTLFQYTSRFERTLTSEEVAELITLYTVIPEEEDLKEIAGILKFIKASAWKSPIIPEDYKNKTPSSGTSHWNTLGISENTSRINFIGLNEEDNNSWIPLVEKLISLPGTSNTDLIIITSKTIKSTFINTTIDKPLRNLYEGTSIFRFRMDIENNSFGGTSS